MGFMISVVESGSKPTIAVRTVTSIDDLPQEIGKAYGEILGYLALKDVKPLGPAYVAYFNMDMQNLEVEIGFPLENVVEGMKEIVASKVPAGKKATCFYKGPYSEIGPTYDRISKWIKDQGFEATGTVYEFYYNSPQEVPESELLTQIAFLLK